MTCSGSTHGMRLSSDTDYAVVVNNTFRFTGATCNTTTTTRSSAIMLANRESSAKMHRVLIERNDVRMQFPSSGCAAFLTDGSLTGLLGLEFVNNVADLQCRVSAHGIYVDRTCSFGG
jgi:hypothetical protein